MAEDTAYAARMKKDAAADECLTVMLDGLKSFFDGHATLQITETMIGSMMGATGHSVRFIKDKPPVDPQPHSTPENRGE